MSTRTWHFIARRVACWTLACSSLAMMVGCEPDKVTNPKDASPGNHHLLMYWGFDQVSDALLNTGVPTFNVMAPAWIDSASVMTFSTLVRNGELNVHCFHRADLDLQTGDLLQVSEYRFPFRVLSMRAVDASDDVMVTYETGADTEVGLVTVVDRAASVSKLFIHRSWSPGGICAIDETRFVAYGTNPGSSQSGFYAFQSGPDTLELDSLILQVDLRGDEMLEFAVSRSRETIFYGMASGAMATSFELYEVPFVGGGQRLVATREGVFRDVSCCADDRNVLLSYQYNGDGRVSPGGHIEFLDIEDGTSVPVDIAVSGRSRGRFTYVANAVLSGSDNGFLVYTAGTFSGEGDFRAQEMWLYQTE